MSQTLFMETTEISAERTIAEIERSLIAHGAAAVLKDCEAGVIIAVSFKIKTPAGDMPFRLPCRWQAIETLLSKRAHKRYPSNREGAARREKAKRVAWRQILRWVEAQMALVETSMVTVEEVFFPYLQDPSGRTLYEHHQEQRLLQAPKS